MSTEVSIDDGFFDLGGHSLLASRLIGPHPPGNWRHRPRHPGAVRGADRRWPSRAAEHRRGNGTDRNALAVLLPLRDGGARPPLFCVHPAVGVGWVYAGLLAHLPPEQPVYGLQARGLTEPDARPLSLDAMAKDYLEQITEVQPTGPYHLLGWSFGAQLAHAIAVHLQARGQEVRLLALLDGYPPGPPASVASADEREMLAALLISLGTT